MVLLNVVAEGFDEALGFLFRSSVQALADDFVDRDLVNGLLVLLAESHEGVAHLGFVEGLAGFDPAELTRPPQDVMLGTQVERIIASFNESQRPLVFAGVRLR